MNDTAEGGSNRPTGRDWAISVGTGVLLLIVALAGADYPPPPGFVVVVVGAAALSGLIALALPRWRGRKVQRRALRGPAAQGALCGVTLWLIALLLPFSGEPTITMTTADHLIGAAVAAAIGAVGAAVLARIA